jgi:uncharacterized membrane protein
MRESLQQPTPPEQSHTVASRVAFMKHPLHPMLVVYPIAMLSLVVVTDLLHVWLGDPFWATASFWMNVVGLAVGVLAGVIGSIDLFAIREVRRHVSAWNHMIAAVMVLALAAAGVWLRLEDPQAAVWPWGLLLSATMSLLVMVAGWLGGTLSFRHGIGVYGEYEPEAEEGDDQPPAE